MSLILIAAEPYSGEDRLASALTSALGYRRIAEEAIVERAAAGGSPHQELWMTLRCAPGWRDRLLHKNRRYWIFLQAALAEEIRGSRAICHGTLADFLVQENVPALRVAVTAPTEMRVENARKALLLAREEAEAAIEMQSEVRRRRLRYLFGVEEIDPCRYDLVVDLGQVTVEQAAAAVLELAREHPGLSDRQGLEDFVLACRAKAALAADAETGHLELAVSAVRGRVFVQGALAQPWAFDQVRRVVSRVPGVKQVDLDGLWLREPEACPVGPPALLEWSPQLRSLRRPALALTALAGILLLALPVLRRYLPADRQAEIRGVVTDTVCGGAHHGDLPDSECVRRCVASVPDAKYALFDGHHLYVLTDQDAAAQLAGRDVVVTGLVGRDGRTLEVASIHPAS